MKVLGWIGAGLAILVVVLFLSYRMFAPDDLRWKVEAELAHRSPSVVVAEIDDSTQRELVLADLADSAAVALAGAEPAIRTDGHGVLNANARVHVADLARVSEARAVLAQHFAAESYTIADDGEGMITLTPTDAYWRDRLLDLQPQIAAVVRRRLHPYPSHVTWLSGRRVQIEALVDDPQLITNVIGPGAVLTFHLVHETLNVNDTPPAGYMVAPGYEAEAPELVRQQPTFTGERLVRVTPAFDAQTNEPVLSFALDARGRTQFCRLTRANTGKRFAILINGQVLTAPRINEPICGGTGQITGNFTLESANNLALMLRSGALPVRLNVVSERSPASTLR